MPKPNPGEGVSTTTIEHTQPETLRSYTAWHHFLARALEKTKAPGFDVHCFVRLGSLPLEADIILLRLHDHADTQVFAKHFGFLVPALRKYLVIEYKSPDDRLTLSDLDTVRAYAMLCKRKYQVAHDEDVAVAMLYSRTEADFFAGCARNGLPLHEFEPGVRSCNSQPMGLYAMDLVALGERQPDHPINLLSARRRKYEPSLDEGGLGPFAVLYEEIFLRELKKMGQMQAPGSRELLTDAEREVEWMLSQIGVERRLRGLSPEERLKGLAPEERLRGLDPLERAKLRELLLKQEG